MKKINLLFSLLCIVPLCYSQNVDSLVQLGIQYHDNGQYDKAIELYQQALVIEPNSALAHSEIAMSYMYKKEYEKSIEHSDIVFESGDKYLLNAYLTKGSCLDYLGETKKSIKLFKKGIRKLGGHYLLYYNLGYNYYTLNDYDKTEEAIVNAINDNPQHPSSHFLLGFLKANQNQKVKSLLCLHCFLLLEPGTERSKSAFRLLKKQFEGNVERKGDTNEITVYMNSDQADSEFGAVNMMLGILEASKSIEENEGKSDEEMFIENTTTFFSMLTPDESGKEKNIWKKIYAPLFNKLSKSEHMDTYCHMISQTTSISSQVWLEKNKTKVNEFNAWLENLSLDAE